MKKLSRKTKAILLIIASILMCLFIYEELGAPALTITHRLRREEKLHLIGPTDILGTEEINIAGMNRLLIAKDAYFGTILAYDTEDRSSSQHYLYREMESGMALLVYPDDYALSYETYEIPVILFDSCPEATKADISILVDMTSSNDPFYKEYHLSAVRTNQGYFRFNIHFTNTNETEAESRSLYKLSQIASNYWDFRETPIPVTVKFYNAQNELIREESFELISAGAKYQ